MDRGRDYESFLVEKFSFDGVAGRLVSRGAGATVRIAGEKILGVSAGNILLSSHFKSGKGQSVSIWDLEGNLDSEVAINGNPEVARIHNGRLYVTTETGLEIYLIESGKHVLTVSLASIDASARNMDVSENGEIVVSGPSGRIVLPALHGAGFSSSIR